MALYSEETLAKVLSEIRDEDKKCIIYRKITDSFRT